MIKASELRIGNLLLLDSSSTERNGYGFVQVKAITETSFEAEGDEIFPHKDEYEYIKPIPLIPKLLEKAGFVDPAGNGCGRRLSVNNTDEICWYKQDNKIVYQTKGSGFQRDFNIKYLHQLQNFYFALTGEELKIEFYATSK